MSYFTDSGKITSLDTSQLRASMKPGWEDLVRRCIQRFHLQNEGEMSFAKKHHQEGKTVFFTFIHLLPSTYTAAGCKWG